MFEIYTNGPYNSTRLVMDGMWELISIGRLEIDWNIRMNESITPVNIDLMPLRRGTIKCVGTPLKSEDFEHHIKMCNHHFEYRHRGELLQPISVRVNTANFRVNVEVS